MSLEETITKPPRKGNQELFRLGFWVQMVERKQRELHWRACTFGEWDEQEGLEATGFPKSFLSSAFLHRVIPASTRIEIYLNGSQKLEGDSREQQSGQGDREERKDLWVHNRAACCKTTCTGIMEKGTCRRENSTQVVWGGVGCVFRLSLCTCLFQSINTDVCIYGARWRWQSDLCIGLFLVSKSQVMMDKTTHSLLPMGELASHLAWSKLTGKIIFPVSFLTWKQTKPPSSQSSLQATPFSYLSRRLGKEPAKHWIHKGLSPARGTHTEWSSSWTPQQVHSSFHILHHLLFSLTHLPASRPC